VIVLEVPVGAKGFLLGSIGGIRDVYAQLIGFSPLVDRRLLYSLYYLLSEVQIAADSPAVEFETVSIPNLYAYSYTYSHHVEDCLLEGWSAPWKTDPEGCNID
jgi:hypothetical protein